MSTGSRIDFKTEAIQNDNGSRTPAIGYGESTSVFS
jgi:hypothetical protein